MPTQLTRSLFLCFRVTFLDWYICASNLYRCGICPYRDTILIYHQEDTCSQLLCSRLLIVPLPLCSGCQVSEASSEEFQWTGSDLPEMANKLHSGLYSHIFCKCYRGKWITTDTKTCISFSLKRGHTNCNEALSRALEDVKLLDSSVSWGCLTPVSLWLLPDFLYLDSMIEALAQRTRYKWQYLWQNMTDFSKQIKGKLKWLSALFDYFCACVLLQHVWKYVGASEPIG